MVFYVATLTGAGAAVTWNPAVTGNKLEIRNFILHPDVNPGERNVVTVETMSGDEAVCVPVVALSDSDRSSSLHLVFDTLVTFKLIEGTGPVNIIGEMLSSQNQAECAIPKVDNPFPLSWRWWKERPATMCGTLICGIMGTILTTYYRTVIR